MSVGSGLGLACQSVVATDRLVLITKSIERIELLTS
jgi:hypothetical protein